MSALVRKLAMGVGGMLAIGAWIVNNNRNNAVQFFVDVHEKYEECLMRNDRHQIASKTPSEKAGIDARIASDAVWFEREVARQRQYLALPFYKQFTAPTFPDYARAK